MRTRKRGVLLVLSVVAVGCGVVVVVMLVATRGDKAQQVPSLPPLVLIRPVPAFLHGDPRITAIPDYAAFVDYRAAHESAPSVTLWEYVHGDPKALDYEPRNPIEWVSGASAARSSTIEAYFRCGQLTVRAGARWANPGTEEQVSAQLNVIKERLELSCAEIAAIATPTVRAPS